VLAEYSSASCASRSDVEHVTLLISTTPRSARSPLDLADARVLGVDAAYLWLVTLPAGEPELAPRRAELHVVTRVITGGADVCALAVVRQAGVGKSRLTAAASDAARSEVPVRGGWAWVGESRGLPEAFIADADADAQ
jgi:hypothetical protein